MIHTTFPWETIRNNNDGTSDSPIEKLIDYVIDAGLSDYLHAATMHYNLRVGRSENFSRNDGELTIEYHQKTNSIIFSYYDSENSDPWEKTCKGAEIISTFKHIISKRLRWVKNGI